MWKAAAGTNIKMKNQPVEDDDWETDPDFINDVTEEEQRWGSRTVEGSGRTGGAIDMEKLCRETREGDALNKKKQMDEGPNASFGYGGKFGVEKDRMDSSAVGHDYIAKVEKHVSQKDYSVGFGGKYGVQTERVDKSAKTWDYKEKIEKHTSQRDYSSGFGGKFGVQSDRQDQSAVGWDHVEKVNKHDSQKDYSVGFGGKFGVQTDRQDKCAVGWDHHEAPQKHESQIDHSVGFGGKFGVQTDRMDKSAASFNEQTEKIGTTYMKTKPEIGLAKPSDLRAKFEKLSTEDVKKQNLEKPVVKNMVQAKTAMFNKPKEEEQVPAHVPKQLDQMKTDIFNKQPSPETESPTHVPKKLNQAKMAIFSEQRTEENSPKAHTPKQLSNAKTALFSQVNQTEVISKSDQIKQEIEQLKQQQSKVSEEVVAKSPIPTVQPAAEKEEPPVNEEIEESAFDEDESEIVLEDTGLTAVALYDYQAAADDEISFDPDDLITCVEMIDEGWWRGLCKNQYGLFPANYVQLQQ